MISFSIFVTVAAVMFTRAVHGQSCQSFGVDIGNGGTYYINPASTAQFSFESAFNYCTTSEAPILQLPDGNTITCSSISEATTGAIVTSTCPINHNQMAPGNYAILFETIGFERVFTIVLFQTTVTETPTVTVTTTPFSSTDTTITSTLTDSNTIITMTTVPAATSGTSTIHPSRVTTTSTKTLTHTRKSVTSTQVTMINSKIVSCSGPTPVPDGVHQKKTGSGRLALVRRALAKRDGPDGALTTTITEVTSVISTTVTAPATTVTNSFTTFVTATVTTTSTQTVLSGTVAALVTASTPTKTITARTQTTVTETVTNVITIQKTSIITPASVATCLSQGGVRGLSG